MFARRSLPGVFFGLNLAIFFAGATNNSVANAALIGSLAPFFIVPIGAKLFREFNDPRALVFALVAFGGVGLVLFSAPPKGDASLEGNVFGFVAMLLLVAYVVSTRRLPPGHGRRQSSWRRSARSARWRSFRSRWRTVTCFGMSGTGWTYMLILTFLSGVAANGLMVYAQKTIQIGTICDRPGRQPAIAVVWSFLLLERDAAGWAGRRHRHRDQRAWRRSSVEPARPASCPNGRW